MISHSRCGLELGQALLLAAAFDEVMGLLVAIERTEASDRVEATGVVERKSENCRAVIARKKALCRSRLAGLRQRPDVGGPPEGEPAAGGHVAGGRVAVAGPLE